MLLIAGAITNCTHFHPSLAFCPSRFHQGAKKAVLNNAKTFEKVLTPKAMYMCMYIQAQCTKGFAQYYSSATLLREGK